MRECAICKRVFGDHVDRCDRDNSPLKITLPISPLISSYRLDERIGSGGLGIVYKGAKIGQTFPLAIKIISPEIAQAETSTTPMFLKEAEAIIKLAHPNIVQIGDFGQNANGALYLVMEFLEGRSLNIFIGEEPEISINTACNIMIQICEAVAFAHKQNKLHYDLKPNNIFIVYDQEGKETVKVLDFGLAKLKTQKLCNVFSSARTQNFFNLPFYLSPEQCDGAEPSTISEVYSLGAIFYHLLVGRPPFIANSQSELMHKHLNEPVMTPCSIRNDISDAIESIILSCLSKKPSERLSSVSAIINLIKIALNNRRNTNQEFHVSLLPATTAFAPEIQEIYHSAEIPLLDPKIYSVDLSTGMPKAPQTHLQIPSKISAASFKALSISSDNNPKLSLITRVLVEALKTSKLLSDLDINPNKLISQLNQQLQANSISKEGELFSPNLIKVFIPRTDVKKFQEMEAIFNSGAFINNIYKYIRESGYRLFSTIKLEIEIVHPQAPGYEGCSLTINWPQADDVSNGLERIVQVDAQKVVKMQMPIIQVSKVALLQPINAATYANYHLIINPVTYVGRFRNVVDRESGGLIRRNDVSFLQPNHPSSPNTTVSRQHGKIEFIEDNFYLYDTGSTNGTKINRRENNTRVQIPIEPDSKGVLIMHRDIIQLGTALLSFEIVPSENVSEFIDRLASELEIQQMQPGSNSEAYKTMVATTSLSGSVVW